MRRYADLTPEEREQAEQLALESIIEVACQGLKFNDELNGDDLQARIDKAFREAERLQTPWFTGAIMLEDAYVRERLEGLARADAEEAHYPDCTESVIRLRRIT